jgi:hypothetical protein
MFVKGQSGNPGGKPRFQRKFQELLALEIQARTGGPMANYFCKTLVDFIQFGDSHKTKFAALKLAMAYAMGNPQQMLEVTGTVDIVTLLKEARERAGLEPLIIPDVEDESDPS